MTLLFAYLLAGIGFGFARTADIADLAYRTQSDGGGMIVAAAKFVVTWPLWVGR